MGKKIQIIKDVSERRIVVLSDIIFKNKQNIDWKAVENWMPHSGLLNRQMAKTVFYEYKISFLCIFNNTMFEYKINV